MVNTSELDVRDRDVAQALCSQLYGQARISFSSRPRNPLVWRMRRHAIGSATLVAAHQNLAGEIRAEELSGRYLFATLRRGAADIFLGRETVDLAPNERGAMVNPHIEGGTVWRNEIWTLHTFIETSALSAHVEALTGTPLTTPPHFKPRVDLQRGPGADIQGVVQLLHATCARTDGAPASPQVLAHVRDALYSGLVFGVESTVSHLFQKTPPAPCPRAVRQAEEYLTAHASEPISITDLASITGVGLRSLQRAFRSARGMSLRAFLTSARLDLARRHLQAAEPGTTVTQVLHASGFGHMGDFSAAYRQRFGESPSSTLRHARSRRT